MKIKANASEEEIRQVLAGHPDYPRYTDGVTIQRVVIVPGRVANIVTRAEPTPPADRPAPSTTRSRLRQSGTTLTSLGARTITLRMPRPPRARATPGVASASDRNSSSEMPGGTSQPVPDLARHLNDTRHRFPDQQRRIRAVARQPWPPRADAQGSPSILPPCRARTATTARPRSPRPLAPRGRPRRPGVDHAARRGDQFHQPGDRHVEPESLDHAGELIDDVVCHLAQFDVTGGGAGAAAARQVTARPRRSPAATPGQGT